MLTLFVQTDCRYCEKVLMKLEDTTASYDVRNIADPENLAKLLEYGGVRQVPFLYESEKGVSLYESEDIISYLHDRFIKPSYTACTISD